MRFLIIAIYLLMGFTSVAQPPKNGRPTEYSKPIPGDSLIEHIDTVKMQWRVWIGQPGNESYLSRVNGYLVQKYMVGNVQVGTKKQEVTGAKSELYFDNHWNPLRYDDLEIPLSKVLKW